jgi:4-hydroxybenzoate polyprenyltransferase
VDLYATACDWWLAGLRWPPGGLYWFLVVSYLNGLVIEIGRKTRAPSDEEHGVDTYSALWGLRRAATAWFGAVVCTALAAWQAAIRIGFEAPMVVMLAVLVPACGLAAWRLLRRPVAGAGKAIETVSGFWTVLMYLGLGVCPLVWRLWQAR